MTKDVKRVLCSYQFGEVTVSQMKKALKVGNELHARNYNTGL
jgi:hypothetical protein